MSEHTSSGSNQPPHLPVGEHAEIFQELPNKVPPLPADASAEEKDLHWYRHVYQGDRMPQLTVRAVLMGGLLGMVMSAANLYTTLSIGWAFGIAITASVLSFVIWNFVRFSLAGKVSQMSVLENACMASCASAAGYSTGSTMATMFGALVLLKDPVEGQTLADIKTWEVTAPWVVVVFTLCTGLMGVFLAIPMKRQQINHEQLPFPSGIAAAETLRSLYSASKEAVTKAYVLVVGLALGLLIGFLRAGDDVLDAVGFLKRLFEKISALRIPADIELHFLNKLYPGSRHAAGFAFEPSALLIAAGMIVGMRTSLSLLVSSAILYGVVAPKLAAEDAAAMEVPAMTIRDSVKDLSGSYLTIGTDAVNAITRAAATLNIDPAPVAEAAQRAVKTASEAASKASVTPGFKPDDAAKGITTAAWTAAAPVAVLRVTNKEAMRIEQEVKAKALTPGTPEHAAAQTRLPSLLKHVEFEAKMKARGEGKSGAEVNAAVAAARVAAEARGEQLAADDLAKDAFTEAKFKPNFIWNWAGGQIVITRWSLWGGTALMVFASLTSVALQWRTIVRAFMGAKSSAGATSTEAARMQEIEVPGSWMVIGMIPITLAMVWLQIQAFGVSWYAGIIAVAMSFVLSLVASRATGETDTTPIGAMGKVMQLLFAVLAPRNISANLASAGIAANSASSSADLLTDLKTGYLLGANPRKQFLAQFFGVFFGTVAIVPIWYLMVPNREKLESFALPSTRSWEAVARVLVNGVGELPKSAVMAIFVGAIVGVVLPIIERLTPATARKYLPSATALGLAWVIPFQNAFSFFIGACIAMIWYRLHKKSSENYNVPIASGLVAGESLMAAALAITATVVGLMSGK